MRDAAVAAAAVMVVAGVVWYRGRRRRDGLPAYARQATCCEVPPATRSALDRHRWLPLRHRAVRAALDERALERAFGGMCRAFSPQQVDYSNTAYAKDHWQLSCFMEYGGGVAAGKIDLGAGASLLAAAAPTLAACDAVFLGWYNEAHPYLRSKSTRRLERLQSFVTRYRAAPDETHLPRHIDGAGVDGSLVLGLPSATGFGGGGLTVWDGESEAERFDYPVGPGDACLLDSRVWHQSNPVTWGERWVLVIFYRVVTEPGTAAAAAGGVAAGAAKSAGQGGGGSDRRRVVRELLARRVMHAARRKSVSSVGAGEDAWQSADQGGAG